MNQRLALSDLNKHQRAIFRRPTADTPKQIDALEESTKLSINQRTAALVTLEMRELIRAVPDKCLC